MLGRRTAALLEKLGAEVSVAGTLQAARSLMSAIAFDIALLDVNLPDGLGTDLLREKRFGPDTTVVLVTAHGGVSGAVEAMRLGAAEYLVKPFEADELPPVLIQGETGTGKTALARWLHEHGPRGERELVEVNCSALPEALAESELFGHERGAFTDARTARMGLFEAASGGTLFLDELPSLSPPRCVRSRRWAGCGCWPIRGRATCANWPTNSNGRSSSRKAAH